MIKEKRGREDTSSGAVKIQPKSVIYGAYIDCPLFLSVSSFCIEFLSLPFSEPPLAGDGRARRRMAVTSRAVM